MEEIKQLSDDVFEQIKDFPRWYDDLSDEQKSLIDKLIPDKELKECYMYQGLCKECNQPKNSYDGRWCRCNFQRNFKNWTSGNNVVDKFIQKAQLKAKLEVLEWIEHDRFEDIEYLAKGGFGTVYKAIWKDGPIKIWNSGNNQWQRKKEYKYHANYPVVLKCLHNSQDITAEFLREVGYFYNF